MLRIEKAETLKTEKLKAQSAHDGTVDDRRRRTGDRSQQSEVRGGTKAMNVLILKLGATGDVVRTTPLLRRLRGSVTWITAAKNCVLLDGLADNLRHFPWEARARALDVPYDLAINLEDSLEVAHFLKSVRSAKIFGAYADSSNRLRYTDNSKHWFDLSLISSYG